MASSEFLQTFVKRIHDESETIIFRSDSSVISLIIASLTDRIGLLLDRRKLLLEDPENAFLPGQFYGYDIACIDEEISDIHSINRSLYSLKPEYSGKGASKEGGAADEK